MTSIITFKRKLIAKLQEEPKLNGVLTGIYFNTPERCRFPYLKLSDFFAETWHTSGINGRSITLNFEIFSSTDSSEQVMRICSDLEKFLPTIQIADDGILVSRIKLLSNNLKFIKTERIWRNELKTRFWIETIH